MFKIHVLLLCEGFSDETGLKKFEKEWHGRTYANGKAKLRVREMKLYTLGINEIGREEFLKDLKGLTGGTQAKHDDNQEGTFKFGKMLKYVRTLARLFGVKPIDDSKIIANPIWYQPEPNLGCNAHFFVIGEVKDQHKCGIEQV